VDAKGGPIARLLDFARPGSVLHMCAMGGLRLKFEGGRILFRGQVIRRIGLLAGGTGIAPMIQIIRAYGKHVRDNHGQIPLGGLNLIYAAEEVGDLAYRRVLEEVRSQMPEHFRFYVILNRPPLGWTEGVGFTEKHDIVKHMMYPPAEGDLAVMCGPPMFESAMRKTIASIGFLKSQWFSFSADDKVSAHL
jgi:ferredoxin-NADP reductase